MAIPSDKNSFKEYCLRKLGAPVIQINVADEQLDDRIDEALYKFYERHYNGVEEVYIVYVIGQNDIDQGYIQLGPDIVAVTDTFRPKTSGQIFSVEYQYQLSELYSFSSIYRFGDLTYYYMVKAHFDLINKFFSPDKQFQYNPHTRKFIILGGLQNSSNVDTAVVIKAYRKIMGEASDTLTSNQTEVVGNIWRDVWVQNYATALIKMQWATNMKKYKNIQILGGINMNGDEMYMEAKEEVDKLEKQLDSEYQLPPMFQMG
jgi:hypothetical protein